MPRGTELGTVGTVDTAKLLAMLAEVLLLVLGGTLPRWEKKDPNEEATRGIQVRCRHGGVTRRSYCNQQAILMPVHKASIARFIRQYVEDWSTAVHEVALFANSNWHEPPRIDKFPGAVLQNLGEGWRLHRRRWVGICRHSQGPDPTSRKKRARC